MINTAYLSMLCFTITSSRSYRVVMSVKTYVTCTGWEGGGSFSRSLRECGDFSGSLFNPPDACVDGGVCREGRWTSTAVWQPRRSCPSSAGSHG